MSRVVCQRRGGTVSSSEFTRSEGYLSKKKSTTYFQTINFFLALSDGRPSSTTRLTRKLPRLHALREVQRCSAFFVFVFYKMTDDVHMLTLEGTVSAYSSSVQTQRRSGVAHPIQNWNMTSKRVQEGQAARGTGDGHHSHEKLDPRKVWPYIFLHTKHETPFPFSR